MADQMMDNSTMVGWAGWASASPAIHPPSGHMAHTATPPIVAPTFSPVPALNGFQVVTPSTAGGSSVAGSPAPSLSFLQVESSPAAQSPSPSSCDHNINPPSSVEDSSTILATTPTGPLFPALTPGPLFIPSTPLPPPAPLPPAPVPAPAPGTSALPSMSASTPMPAPARIFMPILTPPRVPTPEPGSTPISEPNSMPTSMLRVVQTPTPALANMPTPGSVSVPTHMPTTTPAVTLKNISTPNSIPVPTTPARAPIPESLSAFAASGLTSSAPASTPSSGPPPSVDVLEMTLATTHNLAPTIARAPARISAQTPARTSMHTLTRPTIRAPTARVHAPALVHNPPSTGTYGSATTSGPVASTAPMYMPPSASQNTGPIPAAPTPTFTWPGSNTGTMVPTAVAATAVRDWGVDDDLDREIARVAGFELGDTGFQAAERLPELTNNGSDLSESSASTQTPKLRRGKKTASPRKKWTGSLGGELTMHGLPDGVDNLLHRWTFSEDGLGSMDATGRTEGDVHFSTMRQRLPSDPPFKSWVAVRVGEDRLQWTEWQGGHPHPWLTGYVFKPAQLARTQPRWIKKQTWLKSVARGEEADTVVEEGLLG
ncbi:hypothetical protein FS749_014063 [Ceratobasidium sp. UAMH 11750]|nr:hypothetical protein FS749_014063 [Ceratobasidium sp. UAMH 11750]